MIAAGLPVRAQYIISSNPLLDHLAGRWQLKGKIAGKAINHDISAGWVLGHQYLELTEVSREKQGNGMPAYDSTVIISLDKTKKRYDCLCLDNTSNQELANEIIAHALVRANELAFLFTFSKRNYFHTTLSYRATSDSWHWRMKSDENGKKQLFADAIMSKVR